MVRVTGKVNARDRDGRVTSDVKVLAEMVELVSDEVLDSYVSTGAKLPVPSKAVRRTASSAEKVYNRGKTNKEAPSNLPKEESRVIEPPKDTRKERLYILVEDASDVETLTAIRRLADLNLGFQEVVLVLREDGSKRALKMPFKVEVSEDLLLKLRELVGEENVKVC